MRLKPRNIPIHITLTIKPIKFCLVWNLFDFFIVFLYLFMNFASALDLFLIFYDQIKAVIDKIKYIEYGDFKQRMIHQYFAWPDRSRYLRTLSGSGNDRQGNLAIGNCGR